MVNPFKRKPSTEMELITLVVKQIQVLAETLELLDKKIDSLTIPNPLSEDDWLDIASKQEPKKINRINDVKWPDNWMNGRPF